MATWPETLPQKPLKTDYQEKPPNLVLRTEMDFGPAKMRRRFTAGVRGFSWSQRFTAAQLETLDEFYLANCALSFLMPHPRTEETVNMRFVAPPVYKAVGGLFYEVQLQLEILP